MKPSALILPVILALTTTAAADAQAGKPLLQLHVSLTYHGHGTQFADQYLFVAADGTATGQIVTGDPVTALGWLLDAKTARASAAQLQALQEALGQARIGLQTGGCSIGSRLLSEGIAELTWYGRQYRKTMLDLQIGESTCPPELQQLFKAIEDFSGAVLGQNVVP